MSRGLAFGGSRGGRTFRDGKGGCLDQQTDDGDQFGEIKGLPIQVAVMNERGGAESHLLPGQDSSGPFGRSWTANAPPANWSINWPMRSAMLPLPSRADARRERSLDWRVLTRSEGVGNVEADGSMATVSTAEKHTQEMRHWCSCKCRPTNTYAEF